VFISVPRIGFDFVKKFLVLLSFLLVFSHIVFVWSGVAASVVDLSSFKGCPRDSSTGRTAVGSTDCTVGSYYYVSEKPPEGVPIYSSVGSDFRQIQYIYFKGSGNVKFYDANDGLIKEMDVSSSAPVRVGTYSLNAKKFSFTGIDLLGIYYGYNSRGLVVCYAQEGYTEENYKFYINSAFKSFDAVKPAAPASPDGPSVSADLIVKLDEILQELKKKNSCDVCKKLDALLADTNAINNNISQIKITTGYINGHLKNISSYLDRLTSDFFLIREYIYDIRNGVFDIRDSSSSVDTKLDDLGPIKNTLLDISDSLKFLPPDIPSVSIRAPDLSTLDVPTIEKKEDSTVYFSEQNFVGKAAPFPKAQELQPWRFLDGSEVVQDSVLIKDSPAQRQESFKQEKMERQQLQRQEPLQQNKMERQQLQREEPLQRDKPLIRY